MNIIPTIAIALLFGILPMAAQGNQQLLNIYLSGNLEEAKKMVDNWSSPKTSTDQFAQLQAYYVLLNNTMAEEDEETFNRYVEPAQELAKKLATEEGFSAEAEAILAGIYGLKIAYSPMKGMFLGSKSQKLYRKSLKAAPESPLVLTFYGVAQYNTPENWGGSVTRAKESLYKAIEIMGCEAQEYWVYPHARAWLGIVLEDLEQPTEADNVYQQILSDYPNFAWVRNVLQPELSQQKMR